MDERRYELVTLAAARRLRSSYCCLAHGSILLEKFGEPVREIALDHRSAGLDDVDCAVMDFAERVVDDATSIGEEDFGRLRALGLSDTDIAGVVLAATARCFFSKTLDALCVLPERATATSIPRYARRSSSADRSPPIKPTRGARRGRLASDGRAARRRSRSLQPGRESWPRRALTRRAGPRARALRPRCRAGLRARGARRPRFMVEAHPLEGSIGSRSRVPAPRASRRFPVGAGCARTSATIRAIAGPPVSARSSSPGRPCNPRGCSRTRDPEDRTGTWPVRGRRTSRRARARQRLRGRDG